MARVLNDLQDLAELQESFPSLSDSWTQCGEKTSLDLTGGYPGLACLQSALTTGFYKAVTTQNGEFPAKPRGKLTKS